MNQLTRASMRWSRLIGGRRPSSAAAVAPKPFSTEASGPSLGSPDDQFLQTPSTGVVYGRLSDISKHTSKSDIINLLDDSNLSPEKLRVEYNRAYFPLSMLVQFPSASSYDAALRSIGRKGRLYNMRRADKAEWDVSQLHDGKAIVLLGIPRNAAIDDIERFLCGCHSSSIQISVRPTNEGPIRMALVHFPSQALAMHAYITKNRGFCLNNQITLCNFVQVVASAKLFPSMKLVGDLVKESNVLPVDKYVCALGWHSSSVRHKYALHGETKPARKQIMKHFNSLLDVFITTLTKFDMVIGR